MKLETSPKHHEAWEYAQEKHKFPLMATLLETLFYLCRLYQIDPKAVNVKYPKGDTEGVYLSFLHPYDVGDSDEYVLEPDIIEIRLNTVHNLQQAAKFCIVGPRTIERWMKAGLRSFKLGRQGLFIERDLWEFMKKNAVGKLCERMQWYEEGLDVDTNPVFLK
ncbi:hypothetical protein C6A37_01395 [Desulfobacteraceae bacterium SEEP-SAG9]|nr:hypothetical protein C6A37_01395 [Desulfobacteraceae bacterium SEEP-SAG9]